MQQPTHPALFRLKNGKRIPLAAICLMTALRPAAAADPVPTPATTAPATSQNAAAPVYAPNAATPPDMPPFAPTSENPVGLDRVNVGSYVLKPEPQPYLFNLQSDASRDFGKRLADLGVYITGYDISEYQGATGGRANGAYATNWSGLGTNLDMNKILGVPGAQVHFVVNDVAGQGEASRYTGASETGVSNWGNHNGFQLRELTWDQMLFNNKLFFLLGRSAPKSGEFEASELYCQFATFLCSSPTTYGANGSAPAFVTATWGGRVLYKPTPNTYVKAGVWETEPFLKTETQGNWPGPDWGLNYSVGAFIPVEVGYRTSLTDEAYPRQLSVGFYDDTTQYSSPLYNTKGQPLPLDGGKAQTRQGRTEMWINGQQMIWKPDPNGTRGVILFAAANFMTSGEGAVRDGFVAGAFDWGPLASRPRDYLGFVVQTLLFNNETTEAVNDYLIKTHQHGNVANAETMMELNYGINFAPGVKLAPYFEFIKNPDQLVTTSPRAGIKYAMQFGALLDFELGEMLDLPNLRRVRN
jgi:carbohydrate-selective porin OprB